MHAANSSCLIEIKPYKHFFMQYKLYRSCLSLKTAMSARQVNTQTYAIKHPLNRATRRKYARLRLGLQCSHVQSMKSSMENGDGGDTAAAANAEDIKEGSRGQTCFFPHLPLRAALFDIIIIALGAPTSTVCPAIRH